jgi:hypothetical protein
MKLYLARKKNGLYMLTKLEPVRTNMFHTDHVEMFVRPGDPINFQGLCPFSVHALFGVEQGPGEVVRVEVRGQKLPPAVPGKGVATEHSPGSRHLEHLV